MLQSIIDALLGVWDTIQALLNAIGGLITSGGKLLLYLTHTINYIPTYWGLMPRLWTTLFPSLIGIVVIYKFMARD